MHDTSTYPNDHKDLRRNLVNFLVHRVAARTLLRTDVDSQRTPPIQQLNTLDKPRDQSLMSTSTVAGPSTGGPNADTEPLWAIEKRWRHFLEQARGRLLTGGQQYTLSLYQKRAYDNYIYTGIAVHPPSMAEISGRVAIPALLAWVSAVYARDEDEAVEHAWDEYIAAQKLKGEQYAIAAENEKEVGIAARNARRPHDLPLTPPDIEVEYPPRDRQTCVDRIETYEDQTRYASYAKRLGFRDGPDSPGKTWVFKKTLAYGGHAHVGLWLAYDTDHTLVNQLAVKDSYFSKLEWTMEVPDGLRRIPLEVLAHRKASQQPGANSCIVGFGQHATFDRLYMHRIYMEYCDIKEDLHDVMDHHAGVAPSMVPSYASGLSSARGEVRLPGPSRFNSPEPVAGPVAGPSQPPHPGVSPPQPPDSTMSGSSSSQSVLLAKRPIPEVAIWAIFEALARACHVLKFGVPSASPVYPCPVDWVPIYHLDIKPANIFLLKPDPTLPLWPNLPRFKLGDFGLAHLQDPRQAQNPAMFRGMGTEGYMAPEQCLPAPYPLALEPITCATDIYAVGLTMAKLMNCTSSEYRGPITTGFPPEYEAFYSQRLREVVAACLQYIPQQRILAEDLVTLIERNVGGRGGLRARGARPGVEDGLRYTGSESFERERRAASS